MFTYRKASNSQAATIVLSDGTVAGEGYAPDRKVAEYFACQDAVLCGYYDAACGHSVFLSERDELAIRAYAERHKARRQSEIEDSGKEAVSVYVTGAGWIWKEGPDRALPVVDGRVHP